MIAMPVVYENIERERQRQLSEWGNKDHEYLHWLSIIGEEYGEACKAENERIAAGAGPRPVVYSGPLDAASIAEFLEKWKQMEQDGEVDLKVERRYEIEWWRDGFRKEITHVAAVCVAILGQMEDEDTKGMREVEEKGGS